jgi:hypothetical protein
MAALAFALLIGALVGAKLEDWSISPETTGTVSARWSCQSPNRCQSLRVVRALAFSAIGSCPATKIVVAHSETGEVTVHLPAGTYRVLAVLAGERLIASSRALNFAVRAGKNVYLGTVGPSVHGLRFPMSCD